MTQIKSSRPFEYGVATHLDSNRIPFRKMGYATGVGTSQIDVGPIGGTYVFPPAGGIQMQVVSSNVNDTSGGSGIRTVHFNYLDKNYVERVESITLNGTIPVHTIATNILRVNHFHTLTVGSGDSAAGNISLQNLAGSINYSRIATGFNNSLQMVFTIPAGNNGYVNAWQIGSGSTGTNHVIAHLVATTDHEDMLIDAFNAKDIAITQDTQDILFYSIPLMFPEKTDIKVSAFASGGSASVVSTGIHGWYELSTVD